ncbi:fumarylacetoacetate hydrolase family protein [Kutzneria sp. NPDC051319]|uniref:fumarylacetoacetate hydrolase family protein n=1 Tax=Kutzneria sp. NPDC051319 TaxID=3155047 RepID=UPI00341CFA39
MSHSLGLRPSKIIAVHLNHRCRAAERGRVPEVPSYFLKPPSSLSETGSPLVRPRGCELLTYEGEIAVVIGTRARNVDRADASRHIGFFAAANDAGLHDLRWPDRGSNLRSKGGDGFTPVGPSLIPADSVDAGRLRLRTWVNGNLVQDSSSADLIFGFEYLIADLSRTITLEPGDIILTGTPTGAGVVRPGDVVEVEVAEGGRLRNEIVAAAVPLAGIGAMPRIDDEARAVAGPPAGNLGVPEAAADGTGLAPATVEALGAVSTATLYSQLRKRGLNEVFLAGVRPVRAGRRLLGRARTLRYLPLREDEFQRRGGGMNAQKRAVEGLGSGDVLVIEARGEIGAGTIGDILALRAQIRGAAGIVTDGPLRDTSAVADLDIPTYAAGSHAAVLGRRHVPMDVDIPISCGGVLVLPGDVLVGDDDGVIVVPADLVDDVAAAALAQEREEAYVVDKIRGGASVADWYPMTPAARAEYEESR